MKTQILKISDLATQLELIEYAAKLLDTGNLVAFPTETVYGLGADATNEAAIKKIYRVKQRPADNPLIVHISDKSQIKVVAKNTPKKAKLLIDKFWPGPLSIVLPKHPAVNSLATAGLDTVVVRYPSHPVAQALIKKLGKPVVAPSANLSGKVSPTRAEHVYEDLDGLIPLIIDSGAIEYGLESTVVDCTGKETVILRPGSTTLEMIKEVIPTARLHNETDQVASPGMKYRHYATETSILLFNGTPKNTEKAMFNYLSKSSVSDQVILWHSGDFSKFNNNQKLPANSYEAGPHIFNELRKADTHHSSEILIQGYPHDHIGEAIMNRLEKAASKIIDV